MQIIVKVYRCSHVDYGNGLHLRFLLGIRNGLTSFFFLAGGLTLGIGSLLGKLEEDIEGGLASLLPGPPCRLVSGPAVPAEWSNFSRGLGWGKELIGDTALLSRD